MCGGVDFCKTTLKAPCVRQICSSAWPRDSSLLLCKAYPRFRRAMFAKPPGQPNPNPNPTPPKQPQPQPQPQLQPQPPVFRRPDGMRDRETLPFLDLTLAKTLSSFVEKSLQRDAGHRRNTPTLHVSDVAADIVTCLPRLGAQSLQPPSPTLHVSGGVPGGVRRTPG